MQVAGAVELQAEARAALADSFHLWRVPVVAQPRLDGAGHFGDLRSVLLYELFLRNALLSLFGLDNGRGEVYLAAALRHLPRIFALDDRSGPQLADALLVFVGPCVHLLLPDRHLISNGRCKRRHRLIVGDCRQVLLHGQWCRDHIWQKLLGALSLEGLSHPILLDQHVSCAAAVPPERMVGPLRHRSLRDHILVVHRGRDRLHPGVSVSLVKGFLGLSLTDTISKRRDVIELCNRVTVQIVDAVKRTLPQGFLVVSQEESAEL